MLEEFLPDYSHVFALYGVVVVSRYSQNEASTFVDADKFRYCNFQVNCI